MTSIRNQIIFAAVAIAIAGGVFAVLYQNRPSSDTSAPPKMLVSVDVTSVVKQNLRIPIQAQGSVEPLRSTTLIAEVSGKIIETSPALLVGGFVRSGEPLLKIDPRDYQTQVLRAQAALKSANSLLAQERGRAQVAQREWKKLPSGSQRSADAKALYLRQPQLAEAEAGVLAAEADVRTAQDNLERCALRAPYDALITAKQGEVGQFVSTGSTLATVISIDYAEVRLAIPQSQLGYLELPSLGGKEQAKHAANIDLYTDVAGEISHWSASLDRTEGVFDERSRVLYAVARIADPYALKDPQRKALRMGSFVTANISGREFKDIVTLPRHILRAGNYLWVIDKDHILRNRQVRTLRSSGDILYVSGGLEEGELVALTAVDASYSGADAEIISTIPSDQLIAPAEKATAPSEKKADDPAPKQQGPRGGTSAVAP